MMFIGNHILLLVSCVILQFQRNTEDHAMTDEVRSGYILYDLVLNYSFRTLQPVTILTLACCSCCLLQSGLGRTG